MRETDFYSIGKASYLSNITTSTLRYYDSIGLVTPDYRDESSNYRFYSRKQIVDLMVIKKLKSYGCSLDEIKTILQVDDLKKVRDEISLRCLKIQGKIDSLEETLDNAKHLLDNLNAALLLKQNSTSSDPVNHFEIEFIRPRTLFAVKRVIEDYDNSRTSVGFWSECLKRCENFHCHATGSFITTYNTQLLGQFFMKDCELQCGVEIESQETGDSLLKNNEGVVQYGGFYAATAFHFGTFKRIIDTYLALAKWISTEHYEICGKPSEEYVVSPIDVSQEKLCITKIIIPVADKNHKE